VDRKFNPFSTMGGHSSGLELKSVSNWPELGCVQPLLHALIKFRACMPTNTINFTLLLNGDDRFL
jgi:hypothetical protein